MKTIAIDLETFSELDIKKVGLYKYAANCEILLFAYAIDERPVKIIDIAQGEKIPAEIVQAVFDKNILKTAYNAPFEIQVLKNYFGREIDYRQWSCTMVLGLTLGLPAGLEKIGKALKLPEYKLKNAVGKKLIAYFSKPCTPTSANKFRTRNYPAHNIDKWLAFKYYCKQDVESEREVRKLLEKYSMPEQEKRLWELDQKINDNGVLIDKNFVESAINLDRQIKLVAKVQAQELTGGININSNLQLLDWFEEEEGWRPDNIDKESRAELLADKDVSTKTKKVLELKNLISKTSVKKYEAMLNMSSADNRARGMFQFYGANRTGRFTGKGIQLQNLPQNHIDDLDTARKFVKNQDLDAIEIFYGNPSNVLSQLIRTAFIAEKNHRLIVADFSAIEARVIAWLANEKWRMKIFEEGGDIYCASASAMFKVPVEKHGVNKELRAKGKIAELACIAEGQLVLTDKGLIPIEQVTIEHKLWDGAEWVSHEGIVFKGEKEVIEYEGLTATPDHIVWIEGQSQPVQFGIAATCGAHLVQTGNGRTAIWLGENYQSRETLEQKLESLLCFDSMHWMRQCSMAITEQSSTRFIQRLSTMFTTKTDSEMVRQKINSGKTTLRKSQRQRLLQLWWAWNQILLFINFGSGIMDYKQSWITQSCFRNRPNRQQRQLRSWKFKVCDTQTKQFEQTSHYLNEIQSIAMALFLSSRYTQIVAGVKSNRDNRISAKSSGRETKELAHYRGKVKVYDIRNAGRHNRFTVSGKLVHNCGYGGGVNALKAFGADKMGLSDLEMETIIKKWRDSSPNICNLWRTVEYCTRQAILQKKPQQYENLAFEVDGNFLFITLPSKRKIAYAYPRIILEDGKENVAYSGTIQTTGSWGRNFTWGGKLVENIVQATARDCLAEAMLKLDRAGYKIVMHVHDEIISEMENGRGSLQEVIEIMSEPIEWAKGLVLNADGYETVYYRKD